MSDEASVLATPTSAGCAACGACCAALRLPYGLTELRRLTHSTERADRSNAYFILGHWRTITPKEAHRRNPRLVPQPDAVPSAVHFYQCDRYNPVTKQCLDYAHRPPVCREMPFYGKEADGRRLLPYAECSYWHDVPQADWPADVHPLPAPVNAC